MAGVPSQFSSANQWKPVTATADPASVLTALATAEAGTPGDDDGMLGVVAGVTRRALAGDWRDNWVASATAGRGKKRSLRDRQRDSHNLLDHFTPAQRTAWRAYDYTNEVSAEVQEAIDEVNERGGGKLFCPQGGGKVMDLKIKPKVRIVGAGIPYAFSSNHGTIFVAAARDGDMFSDDTTGFGNMDWIGLKDMGLRGNVGFRQRGVHFTKANRPMLSHVFAVGFTREAVRITGLASYPRLMHCDLFGSVGRSLNANEGLIAAVYSNVAETRIIDCEIGSNLSVLGAAVPADPQTIPPLSVALWLGPSAGDSTVSPGTICETADIGAICNASEGQWVGVIFDLIGMHGLMVYGDGFAASHNSFVACRSRRVSLYGNDQFDGVRLGDNTGAGTSIENAFIKHKVNSGSLSGYTGGRARYGYWDNGPDQTAGAVGADWDGCMAVAGVAEYFATNAAKGAWRPRSRGARWLTTIGAQTLDATRQTSYRYQNTAANAAIITGITGGSDGSEVTVSCVQNSGGVVLQAGTGFVPLGNASRPLRFGESVTFRRIYDTWYEQGKNFYSGVGANAGDADLTINAYSPRVQKFTSTLTADRAVTLPTTNVPNGLAFTIKRTGGGAFNLNVGTGPLKALAQNQWVIVVWNATAWEVEAFGSL